jgi:hypothetical protein
MDARNNIATDLFYKIRSRFSGLKLGTETGEITINPEDARFFDFDYMEGEAPIGHVSISLAEPNSMKIYFSHGITETMNPGQKSNWYTFLRELRQFAKRRLLAFDTRDIAKDNLDKRDYAFLSQNAKPKTENPNAIQQPVGESVMNESAMYGTKTMSYQKLMDTRLIIKHNQAVMDDTQPGARTRHISALFVENQDGERFKYPFIHLAGARAMQRHVANGGVPYDEVGKSIIGMSEEIAQLKSFGSYVVRNDLMNSQTNGIVERSGSYLNGLREQIQKLAKQNYYEQYKAAFEAQQPLEVPQDVIEDFTEKFTVRNFKEDIKSVFPVLYRLMQEDNTLGYDDIVAMTQATQESTNEEIEIDEEEETVDPFEQFESWVMGLGEQSAIDSQNPEEQAAAIRQLQELVANEFPVGVDGTNAIESLQGIIDDPSFLQELKDASKQDTEFDARQLVQAWLQEKAPEVLEQLDFGDMATQEDVSLTTEAKQEGDYELEVSTKVFFERGPDGKPVVQKIMLGNTDITSIVDAEETANYIEDEETSPSDGIEYIYVDIDYSSSGKYRPATWGYNGGDPAEYPEVEITNVTAFGNGKSIDIPGESLSSSNYDYLQDKAEERAADGGDDYDDYDDRRDMYDDHNVSELSSNTLSKYKEKANRDIWSLGGSALDSHDMKFYKKRTAGVARAEKKIDNKQSKLNFESKTETNGVQELAEFIKSFYDKDSGTFPKGPEGVCTMVGKKFGEQAESVARKFVERMAPQQSTNQNPELQELARIKSLSGITKGLS